jgi:protein involved in plasmid replication-relaxation
MREKGWGRPANPGRAGAPRRVRGAYVEWVAERLSDRDWQIIEAVNRLRLVSGNQLERLCFSLLSGHAQTVVRGRVLRRLVQWRALALLPRRIGGAARGSAGAVFALGVVGARLCAGRQAATNAQPRVRHPGASAERSIRHTLAVSEVCVGLVERARTDGAHVAAFEAEPASWWPNGIGGFIKPDAYTVLAWGNVRDHWWIEVDLATESLPTMKRKLTAYVDFVERGQLGPHGLIPRVLVSTIAPERRAALHAVVTQLPEPAAALFVVLIASEAAVYPLRSLRA